MSITSTTADFLVADYGSVVIFTPMTSAARDFAHEHFNISSWAWYAGGFSVDHRMAGDLAHALADTEGFTVRAEA